MLLYKMVQKPEYIVRLSLGLHEHFRVVANHDNQSEALGMRPQQMRVVLDHCGTFLELLALVVIEQIDEFSNEWVYRCIQCGLQKREHHLDQLQDSATVA